MVRSFDREALDFGIRGLKFGKCKIFIMVNGSKGGTKIIYENSSCHPVSDGKFLY